MLRTDSPRLGFALLIALLSLAAAAKAVRYDTLDPDCFWHLRVAGALAGHWPGPLVDQLSYASSKEPWTPYSWLAELLMKHLWDAGGYRAAIATQAVLQAAFIALVALASLESSRASTGQPRYIASALAALMAAILSLAYLSFRPVTFALVGLAMIFWLLLRDRRLNQQSKSVWLVPPLCAVLINIHFFAILAPLWAAALLVGDAIQKRFCLFPSPFNQGEGRVRVLPPPKENADPHPNPLPEYMEREEIFTPRLWRGLLLLGLCIIACLMTPMLPGMLRAMLYYTTQDYMVHSGHLAEMGPFYHGTMGHIALALVALLGTCVAWRYLRPGRRPPLGELLCLAGSTILLFSTGRMAPVFAIVAAPMLAATLPEISDRALARPLSQIAIAIVLLLGITNLVLDFPRASVPLSAWLNRLTPSYPCSAADYVDSHIIPTRHHLICDFTWGGYLEWRLGDHYQLLMDGRTQIYPPRFWQRAFAGSQDDRRQILSSPPADGAILSRQNDQFRATLSEMGWRVVYEDDMSRVMVP